MDLHERAERLAKLMEERLDIRGDGLATKTRRAGRRIPRWVRRELDVLVEALERVDHPKLAQQVDYARIETGTRRAEGWLENVDAWDRRKSVLIHWLAGNAMNILIVIAITLALMGWRGLI
ncbi:hypothetical protein [Maritimibacter alexandrii]|jgi:hypothetical protein|uniref:hypothetical protein n=1 Tax=Maritimibacter alexandrii TaxID=2570355 RepID=UPI001108EB96|nr:hypothetical protein [Maritimibacter alexandrii]